MAWLKLVALLFLLLSLVGATCAQGVDLTQETGAMGPDVVRAVQETIENANLFFSPADRQAYQLFIREAAYVESLDGTHLDGGIWRVSRTVFNETTHYDLPALFDAICRQFCINWQDVHYDNMSIPLYSGLAVNLYLHHYRTTRQGLGNAATDMDRAIFWVTAFGESRHVAQWLTRVDRLRRAEGKTLGDYDEAIAATLRARGSSIRVEPPNNTHWWNCPL